MIIYDLICRHQHTFEGWFASAAAFDAQRDAGQVRCPVCDDAHIEKRPSAKVRTSREPASVAAAETAPAHGIQNVSTHTPSDFLVKLREMVQATENVGDRFPEEARKIHYREIPARAIRGQASSREVEALTEEGIDLTLLPPFLLHDAQ
ncbi:MAG: DUF1178 family protein [Proteobacteria bacterium]|nr:DUF1178 family protein [Pseudomonadota bacterium]MCL2308185.1 DUF1178 family protein [Pseudomonadota bacterium]